MILQEIKKHLESESIFYSEGNLNCHPCVIGYDKKFKWRWVATQLNTFIVAIDLKDDPVTIESIKAALVDSFNFAKKNYKGWPRGLQAGMGVIAVLVSSQVDEHAIEYCRNPDSSDKKWAGFLVPVVIQSSNKQVYLFEKNPTWGKMYYPYLKELIIKVTQL